jgi:hypothetical protein
VVLNEYEEFVGVNGDYRVYDIKICNKKNGKYEPIDLNKTYTLAASNYYLLEYGGGLTMLESAKIIQNEGTLDVEVLEQYIIEELGGIVGEDYREVNASITFTEGEIYASNASWVWVIGIAAGVAIVLALVVFVTKKTKATKTSA